MKPLKKNKDKYDFDIFSSKEKYSKFLLESTRQFCRIKFGNKKKVLSKIEEEPSIELPENITYEKIIERLKKQSVDFYPDITNKSGKIEVAHLYSFYKMLKDIFWEATWAKKFTPLYRVFFDEEPDITDKSDHRKYAKEIILSFDEEDITETWNKHSPNLDYPPVIHYKHLTLGPAGLKYSLYPKGKTILGFPKPILDDLLVYPSSLEYGKFPYSRESTDFCKIFSMLLENLKKKVQDMRKENSQYEDYLFQVGGNNLVSWIQEARENLVEITNKFESGLENNKVIPFYQYLSQLSTMFCSGREVLDLLNKLIADEILVVNKEENLKGNAKVTKYGIIKRPSSWKTKPAFELAEDIARIESGVEDYNKEKFRKILREIVKSGPSDYLKNLFESNLNLFKKLFEKKKLYGFKDLEKYEIPGQESRRILLESYGVSLPVQTCFSFRKDLRNYLSQLSDFKDLCRDMEEDKLLENTIKLIREGRTFMERYLKELFFFLSTIAIYCLENMDKEKDRILPPATVVYAPSKFNQEKGLYELEKKYRKFLEEISSNDDKGIQGKINVYLQSGRLKFNLGDWSKLVEVIIEYLKEKDNLEKAFWSSLPKTFEEKIRNQLKGTRDFLENEGFEILNKASHESGKREIRNDAGARKNAVNFLLHFNENLKSFFKDLPVPALIREERNEVETGLRSYEVKLGRVEEEKRATIYGTRIRNKSFTYYIIPLFPKERKLIFPILITNLSDRLF